MSNLHILSSYMLLPSFLVALTFSKEIQRQYYQRQRKQCLAIEDYPGDSSRDELTFVKGDVIFVLEMISDSPCWYGELQKNRQTGFFPLDKAPVCLFISPDGCGGG
jgi:hypothetical protein